MTARVNLTLSEFKASLSQTQPPPLSSLLRALWYQAKGDWTTAHELAQEVTTREGAWVHGYLHLREGDRSNAAYWYQQAQQSLPNASLELEWDRIAKHLLQ